jgi:hypothetical protein
MRDASIVATDTNQLAEKRSEVRSVELPDKTPVPILFLFRLVVTSRAMSAFRIALMFGYTSFFFRDSHLVRLSAAACSEAIWAFAAARTVARLRVLS